MKLYFQRSGGLEGDVIEKKIDNNSIKPNESVVLKELITESRFFDLPSLVKTEHAPADSFKYTITLDDDTQKHIVIRTDLTIEPNLYQLIKYLLERPA